MNTEIKEFIEEHIDLIEDGRFEELYKLQSKWYTVELARLVGIFTETLLSADIDPAKYMKKIPPFYLTGTKIVSYAIPQSITSIDWAALINCNELTSVTIPNSVTYIGDSAFGKCEELTRINFKGTISQWNKIKLDPMWKADSLQLKEIKCTGGTIIL